MILFLQHFNFSKDQRLDKGQDFEGKLIPKKFLPSLFHIIAQPVICTTFLTKGFESNNTSVFSIYFLFIDDHLHTNFYTVMFHLVSINLLKLFLRFILFLSGSLYVGSYRPHIGLGARKCNFLESEISFFSTLLWKCGWGVRLPKHACPRQMLELSRGRNGSWKVQIIAFSS